MYVFCKIGNGAGLAVDVFSNYLFIFRGGSSFENKTKLEKHSESADLLQDPIPPLWLMSAMIKNSFKKLLDSSGGPDLRQN